MTEKKKSAGIVCLKGRWKSIEELRGQPPQPYPFWGSSCMSTSDPQPLIPTATHHGQYGLMSPVPLARSEGFWGPQCGHICQEVTELTGGPGGPGGPLGPSRPRGPCKKEEQGKHETQLEACPACLPSTAHGQHPAPLLELSQ